MRFLRLSGLNRRAGLPAAATAGFDVFLQFSGRNACALTGAVSHDKLATRCFSRFLSSSLQPAPRIKLKSYDVSFRPCNPLILNFVKLTDYKQRY